MNRSRWQVVSPALTCDTPALVNGRALVLVLWPKGAYVLATGGYVTASKGVMVGSGPNQRRISIRAVRRDPPDVTKLAQAFLEIARSEAERTRRKP